MYVLSSAPEDAPDKPQYLQCLFEKGDIVGLQTEGLAEIIEKVGANVTGEKDGYTLLDPLGVMLVLNYLGGLHGIGRVDIVENRFVGMKSRGIYETPGGTILLAAHRDIETITMDREAQKVRDSLIPDYAAMVYNGFWFAPEREAIQALVAQYPAAGNRYQALELDCPIEPEQLTLSNVEKLRQLEPWRVGSRVQQQPPVSPHQQDHLVPGGLLDLIDPQPQQLGPQLLHNSL